MLTEEPLRQTFSGTTENFERPISRPSSKKRPTNSSYHNRHRSNASEKSISRTGESLNESSFLRNIKKENQISTLEGQIFNINELN